MRYPPILAFFFPPLSVAALAATFGLSAKVLTYGGGAIQLVGLAVVVFTLARARTPFNVPSWGESILTKAQRFLRRLFGLRPHSTTLAVHGSSHAHASDEVTLRVKAGSSSVENRLGVLEGEVESLHNRITRLKKETRERVKALRDRQTSDRAESIRQLRELGERIEDVAIGDESLHLAGALLFAWGIAFQTWADWLAGLV